MRLAAILLALLCVAPAAAEPWHPDAGALCLDAPFTGAQTDAQTRVAGLMAAASALLAPFPTLAETLATRRPQICLEDRPILPRGYLDPERNLIVLRDDLADPQLLAILIHELRHLDQFSRGYCPDTVLSMRQTARATFAVEADASAVTALVAWAAKEAGAPELWQTLQEMPLYNDIARAFGQVMAATGDTGEATSAAFLRWYASDWRRETYYEASCSDYLDRLDATKALPGTAALDEEFFSRLCLLPGGDGYACSEPPDVLRAD